MAYPTSIDNFTEKVDNVDDVNAQDVNELQGAIEAIEAKVGANSSAVATSHDYKITKLEEVINNASASAPASLDLHEDTDNGTNKITLTAPSAIASDKTLTLPDATDTLVGKDTTDTLTNKTLSTGVKLDSSADSNITQYGMARQAIMNGNFDVWQRGTSVALADVTQAFLADRWNDYVDKNGGTLPTLTRSRQLLTSGNIPNAKYYTQLATNGAGSSLGVSSLGEMSQKIENGTSKLCGNGKKVTVSIWARSSIANKRLAVTLIQNYGTGVSPSSQETILCPVTPVTLTSTWTKYTFTFTTNTLSGKTFGTNDDDYLTVLCWYMWGSTYGNSNVYAGVTAETFVGAGNIDIAQVQLCSGDVALPFQPKSFEEELRACQRYYEKSFDYATAPADNAGTSGALTHVTASISSYHPVNQATYKVNKRISVTPTLWNPGNSSANKIRTSAPSDVPASIQCKGVSGFHVLVNNVSVSSSITLFVHWTADAEL